MLPEKPITRDEMYLNRIATGSGTIPEKPITREEMYLAEITESGGGAGVTVDTSPTEGSENAVASGGVYAAIDDIRSDMETFKESLGYARYGVTGIGQEASALTRLYDAVGMVAEVGTDGDNSGVRNDFDSAPPFMRRKCVGHWVSDNGHARFVVQAYLGDPDYAEDGSMGDYVAVECPRCYYSFDHDTGTLVISAHKHEGYRAFDIFCRNHNQAETIEKFYAPAYFLGVKDGHAVSLPGLDDEQGLYKALVDTAKTYNSTALAYAMIMPAAWNFYQWALFTVEFATQNAQSIMMGCVSLRSVDREECHFTDANHVIKSYYDNSGIVGQYITISNAAGHVDGKYKATHKILNASRCNEDGTVNPNGNYLVLEVEDFNKGYVNYEVGTTYYYASRPYRTGSCNVVSTPSGSPRNNHDGRNPCKYRWVENPWGNHYQTSADLFNMREGSSNDDWYLDWYYLIKPWGYTLTDNGQPDENALKGDGFVKLSLKTPHAIYGNGHIRSKNYDFVYPDIWVSGGYSNASSSTYFCDNANVVESAKVRSCRFGGFWFSSVPGGPSHISANYGPGTRSALWSTYLFFAQ